MAIFETLTQRQMKLVSAIQKGQQQEWRSSPSDGIVAHCLEHQFIVLPNVFPPRGDTELLARNMSVSPGSAVLDMGTGCGVLAILAVLQGARHATAVDINKDAINNVTLNIEKYGLESQIEVMVPNGFSSVTAQKFDTIFANLPGRNKSASDAVEAAQWDTGFRSHRAFFECAADYLCREGQILMTKANYPELNEIVSLANKKGFSFEILDKKNAAGDDPRVYYALSFALKSE